MIISRKDDGLREKPEVDRMRASFERLCRSRGIRITPQRLAVYRTLAEDLSHPSADSLRRRVAGQVPGLSPATVYRTLEFLERQHLIRRVSAPGGVTRYDANVDRHQHLACRICGGLQDVQVAELQGLGVPSISGFRVEELDIRLVGTCSQCSRRERIKAGGGATALIPKSQPKHKRKDHEYA